MKNHLSFVVSWHPTPGSNSRGLPSISVSWHQKHPTKQQLRRCFKEVFLGTFWNCKMHAVSSQSLKVLLYTQPCQRVLNKKTSIANVPGALKDPASTLLSPEHKSASFGRYVWSKEVDQMPELGDGFMPWAYHAFWERMSAQCKKKCRESSTWIWSHHVFLEPPATKSPQLQVSQPILQI